MLLFLLVFPISPCHQVAGWLPLKFFLVKRQYLCSVDMRCYLCFSDPHFFPRLSQLQHVSGAHPCGWGRLFPGGHGGGGMAVQLRAQAVCTRNSAPAQHHVCGTWSPARMAVWLHPRQLLASENMQLLFHSSVFLYQICTISCVCTPRELPD